MSRATKLFQPQAPSKRLDSVNRDGFPAATQTVESDYLQTLLTNTLGKTFYVGQEQLLKEAHQVHDAMLAKDTKFAAKALVYARNHGYMRTQPTLGLAKLYEKDGDAFAEVFGQVILTPKDLSDFYTIMDSLGHGAGGRRLHRVAGNWIVDRMSEYWAIKYGSEGNDGYSLKDLIRLAHPKVPGGSPLIAYLLGKDYSQEALPQIEAFNRLKSAKTIDEKRAAINDGRLPHEVATSFIGADKALWVEIGQQMPIFALLKNLATLEKHGAIDALREAVESKFANAEHIAKSKILPYRFLEAEKHVQKAWVKDALRDALELSFVNLPDIQGRTAVHLDISISMNGDTLQKAAIFAISLMKKTRNDGEMYLFNTLAIPFAVSMRDSMLTQAARVRAQGGTDVAAPLRKHLVDREKFDNIIVITDEQQNTGSPFLDVATKYRAAVNRNAKIFIVDVAPYRNAVVPPNYPNAHFIYGWSPKVLDYIGLASQGFGTMASAIREGKM